MNRARYIRELDKAHVLPKLNCCELDFCDRSPEEHSFRFADSRFLKDILCVLRESFMSPLLKIRYHEAAAMGFNVVAKGWSMSLQRQRAFCVKALKGLAGRTVLVLGCGFGDDAIAWIPLKPHKIIGVDIVNYNKCWEEAISHYSNNDIRVEFIQSDLVNHDWSFVCTDKVDIIFSYAVLEHISDLSTLLDKAYKVLKPGGLFVATYGPLWYGPNGDHTFPASEDDYYNHLLFNDEDYASYITKTLQEWAHYEHACEGPFLLERGYFSFLKAKEYLVAISSSGFQIIKSILNISPAAERYFVKFPERLVLLKDKYGLENLDLYANGSFVIARKP